MKEKLAYIIVVSLFLGITIALLSLGLTIIILGILK